MLRICHFKDIHLVMGKYCIHVTTYVSTLYIQNVFRVELGRKNVNIFCDKLGPLSFYIRTDKPMHRDVLILLDASLSGKRNPQAIVM